MCKKDRNVARPRPRVIVSQLGLLLQISNLILSVALQLRDASVRGGIPAVANVMSPGEERVA